MKYINRLVLGILSICFFSCVPNKKLIYLQQDAAEPAVGRSSEIVPYEIDEYRFQYNDVVDITMQTTSAELNQVLNIGETFNTVRNMGGMNGGDVFFLNGYTIDDVGMVNLPLVGETRLVGMTVNQAKATVEGKLKEYVKEGNFYVRVRLGGIRYSALGEFYRPGKYTILQNQVTIFEAIANAGDMTPVAKRTDVILIRQYPEGSKTHVINLLSDKIMESEFYFIKPNDLIYVKPLKVKTLGTGVTLAQTTQLALSVLTVLILFAELNK